MFNMNKKMLTRLTFLIILLLKINLSASQTTSVDEACSCDVTRDFCDLNCCCDASCTAGDRSSFNCPIDIENKRNYKWCVPNNMLFFQNTPYIVEVLDDLTCIDIDNAKSLNFYTPVLPNDANLNEEKINEFVQAFTPTKNDKIFNAQLDQTAASFTINDNIWTISKDDYFGYLTLPTQISGSQCREGPPLKYLTDSSSSCTVTNAPNNNCNQLSNTKFGANYYVNDYKIISNPKALTTCPQPYFRLCPGLEQVTLNQCTDSAGTVTNCTSLFLLRPQSSGNKCINLIKKATYIFKYKNPEGFTRAYLDLEFFDSDQTEVTNQEFNVRFIPDQANQYDLPKQLSGNPGYQVGKPIQATNTNRPSFTPLTVLRFDNSGNCPSNEASDIRKVANFGVNMVSECILKISLPLSKTKCQDLQTKISNIILGYNLDFRNDKYGPFATSKVVQAQKILNSEPPSVTDSFQDKTCFLKMNPNINIAYANEGNINNPQAKILYVSYDWSETTAVREQCSSQSCKIKNTNLKVSTRVTFVDVSQPPLYSETKVPQPQATVPDNFFYPLWLNSATNLNPSPLIFLIMTLIVIMNS